MSSFTYSLRALRRTRGLTAAAVLILGLGIGMATAVFSLFESVILRSLPIPEPHRVAVLWPVDKAGTEFPLATTELDRFRISTRTLTSMGGFAHWGAVEAYLANGDQQLHLRQAQVTGNFFEVLRAVPAAGRLLRATDRAEGAELVAVLSYSTWQRVYSGDPAVVGRQIKWLSTGASHTIVGVAPPGLDYPIGTDIWMPVWTGMPVDLIARIAPGSSIEAARAELMAFVNEAAKRGGNASLAGASAQSLPTAISGQVRPAFVAAALAAGILLLIACTNVGNLLLLRAAGRAREIAIRRAVGASRAALFRQFSFESLLLALGGGVVGLAVAAALLRLFVLLVPIDFPRTDMVRLDGTTLLVGFSVTLITVMLTGLAPLLSAARGEVDGPGFLFAVRGGSESRGSRRMHRMLVAGQVALAFIVLSGSSLLIHSLVRLENLSLGYDDEQVTIVSLIPPPDQYGENGAGWIRLFDRAAAALRTAPGVVAVSPLVAEPFTGANTFTVALEAEGAPGAGGATTPIVSYDAVGPDYFRTMGLPLRRGTSFTDADGADTPLVAVVTESIAARLWPGQDPIGKRFRFLGDTAAAKWRTVVGVAGELHYREYPAATPTVFVHYKQLAFWEGAVAVRARGDQSVAGRAMRDALRAAVPEMPVWRALPMASLIEAPLARPRFNAAFLAAFGLAAVILAGIGLFVVVSAMVKQRQRELGIRVALGASPSRLQSQVLGEGMILVAIGGLIGLAIALAGTRLLTGLLFQVRAGDPVALLGACLAVGSAGLLASYLPARRVTEIDPVETLRGE